MDGGPPVHGFVRGFTLIELMLVVAILATLAAIAVPKFTDLIRRSNEGATKGSLGALRAALQVYYAENEGIYPTDNLDILKAYGRYIDNIPAAAIPPYHSKLSSVYTGTGVSEASSSGGWLYDNVSTDANWGTVWVNCDHTDTKATIWRQY